MDMFKALNDTLITEPEPVKSYEEQKGYTHVITPDKFHYGPIDPPVWAKVIQMGEKCDGLVSVGDRVLYGKFCGARFWYEDKEYISVKEADLLAVDK